MSGHVEQPAPVANASTPIIERVIADLDELAPLWSPGTEIALIRADLLARAELGRERYGVYLQAHNGRDATRDAYEEALDLAMYLRQLIEEEGQDRPVELDALYGTAIHMARRLRRRIASRAGEAPRGP